jgi:lambda repressor-like predicted transcriptional regulator
MLVDLYGETGLREMERKKELAHARELAAIRRGDGAAPIPQSAPAEPVQSRRAFVEPILAAKGWSILDWANEADVAYHTAADYLAGTTKPYRSSRVKLAKALGVSVQQLPK